MSNAMQVSIDFHGTAHTFSVPSHATVQDLINEIRKDPRFQIYNTIKLVFGGEVLDPSATLSSCGVKNRSNLTSVLTTIGG